MRPLERFLQQGLGFRFSDRMGTTASWWHCDDDHHGMAIVRAPRSELSHYAFTVEDLNAMGRVADRLKLHRDARLIWGPSRHGPGNNQFMYFHDHDGAMIELCSDIAQMGDYQPRRWPGGLKPINQWGGPPPAAVHPHRLPAGEADRRPAAVRDAARPNAHRISPDLTTSRPIAGSTAPTPSSPRAR